MKEISLPVRRFLTALGQYQRQGRFVSSAYGTELGLTEGYIVVELATDPLISPSQLAKILAVNKATVSRAIASLLKRRFLKSRKLPSSSRKRELILTELAQAFLHAGHRERQQLFKQCSARLSSSELAELSRLLVEYCESEGAPQKKFRPDEHPLTICMRRLAHSHQIAGTSFMNSGHSSTEWQILSLLNYSPDLLQAANFIEALTIQPTTLSQILNRMTARGWISRQRQAGDRRIKPILLTPAGRRVLAQIEQSAAQIIEKGFSSFDAAQLERLVSLFEKYAGGQIAAKEGRLIPLEAGLNIVTSTGDLQDARAFVIEQAVRTETHRQLGPAICSPDNFVAVLISAGELAGVIEFTLGEKACCLNYAVLKRVAQSPLETNFVLSAAGKYLEIHGPERPMQLPALTRLHHSKKATLLSQAASTQSQIMDLRSQLLGERQPLPLIS